MPELAIHYRAWLQIAALPLVALAPYFMLRTRTGLGVGGQVVAATMVAVGRATVLLCLTPLLWIARTHPRLHALSIVVELVTFAYTVWAYAGLQ